MVHTQYGFQLMCGPPEALLWIAVGKVRQEPCGSAEGAFGGEVWSTQGVAAGNLRGLLHPMRVVLDALPRLRPTAGEVICLCPFKSSSAK